MSDTDKPNENAPTPSPAPEAPAPEKQADAPQKPAEERRPARVQLRRDKSAQRKPLDSPRPPSLEHEQSYGFGKKIDAFDDEMARQLEEAMGGMSTEALLGEPIQYGKRAQPAQEGPKKGKVFRIHGQDVFIDLPGGRSQGVLPLVQFPEGPPKIGQDIVVGPGHLIRKLTNHHIWQPGFRTIVHPWNPFRVISLRNNNQVRI